MINVKTIYSLTLSVANGHTLAQSSKNILTNLSILVDNNTHPDFEPIDFK